MSGTLIKLRLYIAGDAPNSRRAMANLQSFCHCHLPERCEIEIIDLFARPERALEDMVLLTPTLMVVEPSPVRSVVGDLADPSVLLDVLSPERAAR